MTDSDSVSVPFQATYLLVLPDPVPVPHGTTWSHEVDEDEPLLEGTEIAPVDGLEPIVNSGKNYVSLKFWQLHDDKALPSELEYGGVLASRVLSMLTGLGDAIPFSREAGEGLEQPFRTVVEAVTFVAKEDDLVSAGGKPDPLTRCIDVLLSFHRAYRLATHKQIRALTYERLHPMVLWTRRELAQGSKHDPMGVILLENRNLSVPDTEELTREQFHALNQYFVRSSVRDPFTSFAERRLEAQIELWAAGEIAKSIVETAIAAEVLFDAVLGMMMWEESMRGDLGEDDAAKVFNRDVTPRLKTQYSSRLGGNWSFVRAPMKDWFEQIAGVRNRVVHSGYHPTKREGADAIETLRLLEHFVGDRLAANWKKYPRTSWAFLGTEGFERRRRLRAMTSWLEQDGGNVRDWFADYSTWRDSVNERILRRRAEQ